jgi:drug/metabolite transporter (DMT)-like permease
MHVRDRWAPALALVANAFVWGVSWWPLRRIEELGVHPLWATVLMFALASALVVAARPRAVAQLVRTPALWLLMLASGTTNAAFNWGVVIGDVMRVVLLFYLMPLWAVLLARLVLHEPVTRAAGVRIALALAGAAIVLWPPGGGLPLPASLADWLGVAGGFAFALNNVILRREARRPPESRALAMFFGCVVVAGVIATALTTQARIGAPPGPALAWIAATAALGCAFLASNFALQYGAAHLPANVTSVIMLTELLFASLSAAWLGGGTFTPQLLAGGALILLAALLAGTAEH